MTNKTTDAITCDKCGDVIERAGARGNIAGMHLGCGGNYAQDALQAAIESLGAKEVAPGRYAVKNVTGRWFFASATNLLLAFDDPSAVESMFRSGDLVFAPAWWTPDARYCYRAKDGLLLNEETELFAPGWTRHTADLATGEELESND